MRRLPMTILGIVFMGAALLACNLGAAAPTAASNGTSPTKLPATADNGAKTVVAVSSGATVSGSTDPQCMPQNPPTSDNMPVMTSLEIQPGTRVDADVNEIRYQIDTGAKTVEIVANGVTNAAEVRICWAAVGAGGDPLHFLGKATINGTRASLTWAVPADFKFITFWPILVNASNQSVMGHGISVVAATK